ncbi:MAG: hypothetical protein HZC40_06190 [Chloroflexi bacterium]|nr:hypothetical protein [Chloroflexota bacterium]
MKITKICVLAILIALGATLALDASAFACEPRSEFDSRCEMPKPKPRVVARPAPTPTAGRVAVAATPAPAINPNTGGSPQDAVPIDNKWQIINANSAKWYRIDNGVNFYMEIFMDTKNHETLRFAAFAPAKSGDMSVTSQPTGRSSPFKDNPQHDFFYRATHAEGVWHLVVQNDNPFPVEHRLSSNAAGDDRSCKSFWRIGSDGKPFWYTDCGMYNMNK